MKSAKHLYILSILFMTLMGLNSVSAQEDHPIVGSWGFNEGPSFARIESNIKEKMDSIPSIRTQVFAGYQGRVISFLPNGNIFVLYTKYYSLHGHIQGFYTVGIFCL